MRVIIQRVIKTNVTINNIIYSQIGAGLLIFLGIEDNDADEDIEWLCRKIYQLRIFNDHEGIMNVSLENTRGEILVISQFTLFASTKKGNRPSYTKASKPNIAIPLYEKFILNLKQISGIDVKTGVFGADMQICLINDGPVTIIIDSKNKE
jgi:D-aminoacyl-tRNA deacylase